MRGALEAGGIDASKYAGHSFRIGAATTAAMVGIEDSLIKEGGRVQPINSMFVFPDVDWLRWRKEWQLGEGDVEVRMPLLTFMSCCIIVLSGKCKNYGNEWWVDKGEG